MKKIFFTVCFLFSLTQAGFSQNFTFERVGPEVIYGDTGGTGQQYHHKAIYKNTSSQPIHFFIERTQEIFPDNTWNSSLCTDFGCYASFVNIVPDTSVEENELLPGEQDTLTLYFYGQTPGLGTVYLRMYEQGNSSAFIERIFKAQLGTVGITQISSVVEDYKISQNYPNPFNPSTKITFSIPKSEKVSLKVFDILGNEVAGLVNEILQPGTYEADFNASEMASGIYFYTIKAGNFIQTKKMILQK